MTKNSIIDQVIAREGGKKFTNSASDSGGETRWGITEATARADGYEGDMRRLPRARAVSIYAKNFWPDTYDEILDISPSIVAELFDTGVNLGLNFAGTALQRSLNVLNRQARDYADIDVDGIVGSATVDALKAFLKKRRGKGEHVILTALNCLQGARYIELAEAREKDEDHLFGWLGHRIVLK